MPKITLHGGPADGKEVEVSQEWIAERRSYLYPVISDTVKPWTWRRPGLPEHHEYLPYDFAENTGLSSYIRQQVTGIHDGRFVFTVWCAEDPSRNPDLEYTIMMRLAQRAATRKLDPK